MDDVKQIIKSVSWRTFLAVFVVSGVICVFALRHNNTTMVKLRSEVYAADKANGDVSGALNRLRNYVYSHMNTSLNSGGNTIKPPIQLKYTYERLEAKAQRDANNKGLYTEAENYCQARIPASVSISGSGRIDCVQNYILTHGGHQAAAIPAALYEFDFISPTWSPDLAGWTLVIAFLGFTGFSASFLIEHLGRIK